MDWETTVKIAGGIIAAIGSLLTIGEKLFTWSKSAYQSFKKIYPWTRARKNDHLIQGSCVKATRVLRTYDVDLAVYNPCPRQHYLKKA
jgi:hypothetical protein